MTAAVAVLSPIFEVDLPAEQHGYRAHFSAHTAVRSVRGLLDTGHARRWYDWAAYLRGRLLKLIQVKKHYGERPVVAVRKRNRTGQLR